MSWSGFESLGDDLVWCLAVQHALAAAVVSLIEATQQLLQGAVRIDVDVEHLAGDPPVEALDHASVAIPPADAGGTFSNSAVGLRRSGRSSPRFRRCAASLEELRRVGVAILRFQVGASLGESWRETAAIIGQHVGEAKRKRRCGFAQEGDGAALGLVVLDREVDRAGAAVDGGVAEGSTCEARGMATEGTNRKRLRRSPLPVCSFGRCLMSI